MKDKENSKNKKYRHGIEVEKKQKIKKSDLLKRIELLEAKLAGVAHFNSIVVSSTENIVDS